MSSQATAFQCSCTAQFQCSRTARLLHSRGPRPWRSPWRRGPCGRRRRRRRAPPPRRGRLRPWRPPWPPCPAGTGTRAGVQASVSATGLGDQCSLLLETPRGCTHARARRRKLKAGTPHRPPCAPPRSWCPPTRRPPRRPPPVRPTRSKRQGVGARQKGHAGDQNGCARARCSRRRAMRAPPSFHRPLD